MIHRMVRAARLDSSLYDEVVRDQTLMGRALLVVILGAVSSVVGHSGEVAFVHIRQDIGDIIGGSAIGSVVGATMAAALLVVNGWLLWSFSIFAMGRLLASTANYGQLFRALGFAATPLIFGIVFIIPSFGTLLGLVATIWYLTTGFTAVRQALRVSSGRAVAVLITGSVIFAIGMGSFLIGMSAIGAGLIGLLVFALAPGLAAAVCLRLRP